MSKLPKMDSMHQHDSKCFFFGLHSSSLNLILQIGTQLSVTRLQVNITVCASLCVALTVSPMPCDHSCARTSPRLLTFIRQSSTLIWMEIVNCGGCVFLYYICCPLWRWVPVCSTQSFCCDTIVLRRAKNINFVFPRLCSMQGVALLPFIDEDRLLGALDEVADQFSEAEVRVWMIIISMWNADAVSVVFFDGKTSVRRPSFGSFDSIPEWVWVVQFLSGSE